MTRATMQVQELEEANAALARRFAESCYGESVEPPTRAGMLRLAELGLVVEVAPGQFAETPAMREVP